MNPPPAILVLMIWIAEVILQTPILLAAIALFVAAAYGDIRSLRIPNLLCAAVAILGVLHLLVIGDLTAAYFTMATCVLIFLITFLLFSRGIIGGGDAKLLAATVLLIGYHDLFPFFMIMSLFGALVSLIVIVLHSNLPLYLGPRLAATIVPRTSGTRPSVPYGVAIAAAGIITLLFRSPLIG